MPELIDQSSATCGSSLLDLFSVPPTQVSLNTSYYQTIRLNNSCTPTGPWSFTLLPSPQYAHLYKNYLVIDVAITKEDGSAVNNDGVAATATAAVQMVYMDS